MQTQQLGGYITVKQYAQKHGISVQAVYKRINSGYLKYKRIGYFYFVKPE
jgi:predicted DNA-binding transcriptional regulator AlpA